MSTARSRAARLAALALLLGRAAPVAGQEIPLPPPDTRVRFTALEPFTGKLRATVGTVVSATPDSLVVRSDRRAAREAVGWSTVTRLDESAGHRSRGATVALSTGLMAVGGAGMGWLLGEDCRSVSAGDLCLFPRTEFAAFLGALGAATGLAGGLIAPRQELWTARTVPRGARLGGDLRGPGIVLTLPL
jgi:hypothetical protein